MPTTRAPGIVAPGQNRVSGVGPLALLLAYMEQNNIYNQIPATLLQIQPFNMPAWLVLPRITNLGRWFLDLLVITLNRSSSSDNPYSVDMTRGRGA